MEKNKEKVGLTNESLFNFQNTVSVGFAATFDEEKENSDEDPEERMRQRIKQLETENAHLKERLHSMQKKKGSIQTTRHTSEADSKAELLSFLSTTRLFSAKIALNPKSLKALMEACPGEDPSLLFSILKRLSQSNDLSTTMEELISKVKNGQKESQEMSTVVLNYLQGSKCKLWREGAPELKLQDINKFGLMSGKFFAFVGPTKMKDGGKDYYQPASQLSTIPPPKIADACIAGLKRLQEKNNRFDSLDQVILAMKKEHEEEMKRQDVVLDASREAVKVITDFFNSGVSLFSQQCQFSGNHLKDMLDDSDNSGAMVRRKLEQIVIRGLLFDTPEGLVEAVSTEKYLGS